MKRINILVILGLILAAQVFAQQQALANFNDLNPVAYVNLTKNEPILGRQVRNEVVRLETQAKRTMTPAERSQVLTEMINERLLLQAAERDRVTISDNDINQQIQQLRSVLARNLNRQPTDAEFATAVKNEFGVEMPAFREQLRRQFVIQKYIMEKKGEAMRNDFKPPSEADIQNFFQLNRATAFVRPDTVRFSIISAPFTDAASKIKAKETADRLAREIGGDPSKFDEYRARGQAANAGFTSGDGGYLPRNPQALQLVGQEFMNVAFSLKIREVSKVIENVQGYQIIMITESFPQRNLELDDIFQLGTNMTVRDYIGNGMLQQLEAALIQKHTQDLITELRGETTATSQRTYRIVSNLNW